MFKKEKVRPDPARERPKPTATQDETAAYEDSWYRSLKALADRRRNHDDNHNGEDGRPDDGAHGPDEDGMHPARADGHSPAGHMRHVETDEDVSVPED